VASRPARLLAVFLVGAIWLLAGTVPAWADQVQLIAEGREDYTWHCAACHGETGRGDGPMAEILVLPPTDLTGIAEKHGGEFPFWRVFQVVAGEQSVTGHETFQMPEFWSRFRGDEGKPGYLPARIRILLLTHYLESIQQP
jgi:mono/diheme cytochrome c family protein